MHLCTNIIQTLERCTHRARANIGRASFETHIFVAPYSHPSSATSGIVYIFGPLSALSVLISLCAKVAPFICLQLNMVSRRSAITAATALACSLRVGRTSLCARGRAQSSSAPARCVCRRVCVCGRSRKAKTPTHKTTNGFIQNQHEIWRRRNKIPNTKCIEPFGSATEN